MCGEPIKDDVLEANPMGASPQPPAEALATAARLRRIHRFGLLAILLVLAVPIPFGMRMLKSTGQARRESWQRMDVPGELAITVDKPTRYGVYLPESQLAGDNLDAPSGALPGGTRIAISDDQTGQGVALTAIGSRASRKRDTVEGVDVRLEGGVELPAAGTYRVIAVGDEPGAVYLRASMLARMLMLIAVLAAPLVCSLLLLAVLRVTLVRAARAQPLSIDSEGLEEL